MDGDDLAVAPDGSPVLLYLVLSGDDEAAFVDAAIGPGDDILELAAGRAGSPGPWSPSATA